MSQLADGKSAEKIAREDAGMVKAARGGDREAFEALVRRYQRRVTGLAYRLLNDRDDAAEVAQEAFLKAYDKLATLTRPGRFRSWLLRITSNLALNRRRARALRRMPSLDAADGGDDDRGHFDRHDEHAYAPETVASARELKRLIARELDSLPEMQRQALVLFSIEKLPQKEVAELLGCSVEAVKWHVFTARKKLKEKLREYL